MFTFKSIFIFCVFATSTLMADPIVGLQFAKGKITVGPSDYTFKQFFCRETKGEMNPNCVNEYDLNELIRSKVSTLNIELQYKFGVVDQRPTAVDTEGPESRKRMAAAKVFKESIKNPNFRDEVRPVESAPIDSAK